MRIVSVLPSATEIVCALGAQGELVGRSAECDYPRSVTELPIVMRPRTLDPESPSAAIDARVREARSRDESLYELDIERLRSLRPDLLLTQDLCGVCSVTDAEVTAACAVAGVDPRIVSLTPRTLEEVWSTIVTVGGAIGRRDAGERLAEVCRQRAAAAPGPRRPSVAVVEWLDPPILAGLWTPDIVRAAGGEPLGPVPGGVGQRTSWPEIARARPELVVLSPCSFAVERTARELEDRRLRDLVGAVAPPRGVVLADEAYFSRPGPRLADGVALVASLLREGPPAAPMPVARWGRPAPEAEA